MPMLPLGISRLLVLVSKFEAGKEACERAFRCHCAAVLARALPLRLVEEDVRSTHWAVIEGRIKHGAASGPVPESLFATPRRPWEPADSPPCEQLLLLRSRRVDGRQRRFPLIGSHCGMSRLYTRGSRASGVRHWWVAAPRAETEVTVVTASRVKTARHHLRFLDRRQHIAWPALCPQRSSPISGSARRRPQRGLYCGWIPAFLMTPAHFSMSAFIVAAVSLGVVGAASAPKVSKRSRMSGVATIFAISF